MNPGTKGALIQNGTDLYLGARFIASCNYRDHASAIVELDHQKTYLIEHLSRKLEIATRILNQIDPEWRDHYPDVKA